MEEMSHSRFLFTTADGESLEFYVRLCAEKDRIAALILHGGGIISGSHALNVIKIVSSNRAFTVNDVGKVLHMQYILDCVEQNKLLDMSGYTLRNSKPVNEVSSEDDWDSDIETEDSSSDFDDSCHSKGTRKKAVQSQIRCRNVPKFPTVESRKIIDYILKHADRINGMTQLGFSRELFKNKVASGTVRALQFRLYRLYYDIALYKLTIEKEKLVKSALLNMKEKAFKEKKDSKENESNNVQAKSSEGQKVRLANTENKKIVKYVLRNADKLRGLGRDEFYKKFLKKNIVSSLRGPFDQRLHRIFNHFEVFKLTSEEEKIFKDVLLSLQRKKILPKKDIAKKNESDNDATLDEESDDFSEESDDNDAEAKRTKRFYDRTARKKMVKYIVENAERLQGKYRSELYRELKKNKVVNCVSSTFLTYSNYIINRIESYNLTAEQENIVVPILSDKRQTVFTWEEDMKLINYVIKNKLHGKVRGDAIYREMAREKLLGRSALSMQNHFRNMILPNLDKYNLPDHDVELLKSRQHSNFKRADSFTSEEDMKLINYVIKNKLHKRIKGHSIYREMAREKLLERSVMSMRTRFLRGILPNLDKYNLPDHDVKLLRTIKAFRKAELFIWEDDMKLINYVIKNELHKRVKEHAIYREMAKEKLLMRSASSMRTRLLNAILPNLDKYNLPDHDVELLRSIKPFKRADLFTWEEDMKLINYVIKNKLHKRVKGHAIYREMAREKLLERSVMGMRTRFLRGILPSLDKYNLPDHDVKLLRSLKPFKKAEVFTREEDMKLINYVIEHKLHSKIRKKVLYDQMAEAKLSKRSASSMMERFVHKILPNLDGYNLSDHELELFKRYDVKRPTPWLGDPFTQEEEMKMINYVIKHKLHDKVREQATYKEMAEKNLLKRSRTVEVMQKCFIYVILPNLDKYNLPDRDFELLKHKNPAAKHSGPFTREEDMKMINYVIENKVHGRVRTITIYKEMRKKKLLERYARSMYVRFTEIILPNLDKYNLSDHDVELLRCPPKERNKVFTREEDMKMINYVIENKLHDRVREDVIYKEMLEKKLLERSSAYHVRRHFVSIILRKLDRYNLSDHDFALLQAQIHKITNFTREEDMKMINYVIKHKLHDKVRKYATYVEMEEEKVLERSATSMLVCFTKRISQNLDSYNLSDHDVELLTRSLHSKRVFKNFTREDDMKMINYVIENKLHHSVRRVAIYREMAEEKVLDRSAQSLHAHFTTIILAKLDSYNLPDHDIELLRRRNHRSHLKQAVHRKPKMTSESSDEESENEYSFSDFSDDSISLSKHEKSVKSNCSYNSRPCKQFSERRKKSDEDVNNDIGDVSSDVQSKFGAKTKGDRRQGEDFELLAHKDHQSHLKQAVPSKPKMTSESSDEDSENEYSFSDFSDDSISLSKHEKSVKSNCSYNSRPCKQFSERRKKSDEDVNNDIGDVSSDVQSKFGAKTTGDRRQGEDFELLAHKDHQSHLKQAVPPKPKMISESSDEDSENEYSFSDFSDDSFSLSKHEKSVKSNYSYKSRTYKQKAEKRKKSDEDVNNDIGDLSSDDFVHTHKAKKPCRLSSTGEHMDSPPANNRSSKISVKCRNSAVRNKAKSPKQNRETVTTYNIHETSRKTSNDSQTMTPKRTNGSYKISQYFSIAKESSQNELEVLSNAEVKEKDDKERSNAASQVKRKIQRTLKFADAKKRSPSLPDTVDDLMCSNKELSGLDFDVENNATDTLINGLPSSEPENSGAVLQNTLPSPLSEIQDSTISKKDSSIWASDESTDDTCGRNEDQTENGDNLLNMLTDPAYEASEEFVSPTAESLSLFGNEMLSQNVNDEVGGNRVANPEGSFSAEQDHFTECISILKDIEADIVGMDPSHKRNNLQNNIIELHSQLYQQRFKGSIRNIVNKEKLSITDKAILWKYIAYTKSKKPEDFVCDFES